MEKDDITAIVNAAISDSHKYVADVYKSLFDNSLRALSEQLAQFEERNTKQHNEIIMRQKETNGRVTNLEKETAVIRWACKNPKTVIFLAVLLIAGIIALSILLGVEKIINFI